MTDFAPNPADVPVVDQAYLDDMRGWIGDETLAALIDGAPDSLLAEVAAIRAGWEQGDLEAVREAGHRLKGAAGSIALRRLSAWGHRVQLAPDLDDAAVPASLDAAVAEAAQALLAYRRTLSA